MKQITIYELLPLLKKGWVAMDKSGDWYWYDRKPVILGRKSEGWRGENNFRTLMKLFNIAPFDGDWKDSLIKVEHKEEE